MTSTLWVTGAPAVGKSVSAWATFQESAAPSAYLDIDQLGMLYPERERDEYGFAVKNDAYSAMMANYSSAGIERVLVSGVIDPRPNDEATRLAGNDIVYCLLTIADDVLRSRLHSRGWSDTEADEAIEEQSALKTVQDIKLAIATDGLSVSEVASRIQGHLVDLGNGKVREATKSLATTRCVFVTGPRAVGCSSVGYALARSAWSAELRSGFVDLTQLSYVRRHGSQSLTDSFLGLSNLATLSNVFAMHEAELTIANGHLSESDEVEAFRRSFPDSVLVRLRARPSTIESHIQERVAGTQARLTGDDLADATPEQQKAVLEMATDQQQRMDDNNIGDMVVDIDGLTAAEVAGRLQGLLPS